MVRVSAVEVLEGFTVRLTFTDGAEKVMDLEPYLLGPVFQPLRGNPELFREVEVDPELGTIVWPNGADLDPDVLYADGTPAWAEGHEPVS